MAELLSEDEVRAALEGLEGWQGSREHLVREVSVPARDHDALEAAVMKVADELNHHPEVERTGDKLRFVVWTHSAGGVTAKDVELAGRIDQVLSGPRATS